MKKVSKKKFESLAKSILVCLCQCPNDDARVCLYYRLIAIDYALNFENCDYYAYLSLYSDVRDLMLSFSVN